MRLYLNPKCYKMYAQAWNVNLWFNEWLFEHGCQLTFDMWNDAIYEFLVKILEWLKAKNCPWNKETF